MARFAERQDERLSLRMNYAIAGALNSRYMRRDWSVVREGNFPAALCRRKGLKGLQNLKGTGAMQESATGDAGGSPFGLFTIDSEMRLLFRKSRAFVQYFADFRGEGPGNHQAAFDAAMSV